MCESDRRLTEHQYLNPLDLGKETICSGISTDDALPYHQDNVPQDYDFVFRRREYVLGLEGEGNDGTPHRPEARNHSINGETSQQHEHELASIDVRYFAELRAENANPGRGTERACFSDKQPAKLADGLPLLQHNVDLSETLEALLEENRELEDDLQQRKEEAKEMMEKSKKDGRLLNEWLEGRRRNG
ncbi:hypothetical protein FSARC_14314 [Fusarium sarcochroum]|uniref:Uncharacterized protein n=1 Tax=Fusarium sarcochroum TaxID=1208366 RepID=A0A8H4WPY0_9HYPO|nr:hypothetical protein FSARC_14314 [Fusarium sarcochroum]